MGCQPAYCYVVRQNKSASVVPRLSFVWYHALQFILGCVLVLGFFHSVGIIRSKQTRGNKMPLLDYIKRIWTWNFHTDLILNSMKTRKGSCKMCGKCCTMFGRKCIFLDHLDQCSIYRFRPTLLCKVGPLNLTPGEIKKHEDLDCGFYWEAK